MQAPPSSRLPASASGRRQRTAPPEPCPFAVASPCLPPSTAGDTPRSDLHRALPSTSASASHGHERHQQQVQAVPPSPSPPSCTSSPALSVGAMPLGARSRVAGVPPQRCRLEPPPCAKYRHGHHLPDALAAASRSPRCHQRVPWPPPRTLESARPHGRSNDYTLKRQVPHQYV
nr:WAS/WASL-interacting protein family member 1-like [Aegilops tauschii subsp. strangulata]